MTNERVIWESLRDLIANPYGIAGLMGNLMAESGLEPACLEGRGRAALGMTSEQYTEAVDSGTYKNFVHDGYGYGLAQWTYFGHKDSLLKWAGVRRKSIGSLDTQINFLRADLREFSSVLHVLQRATDIRTASDDVLLRYEKPADTSEAMKEKRARLAQEIFDRNFREGDMDISNTAFCTLIQQALHDGWGYIWGTYGETWTEAKQAETTNEMAQKYGAKWIGHRVADCSGLGYWAFHSLGGTTYHGSNTMWNEYTYDHTTLVNGKRKDGKPMWPGDPVFINTDGRRTHVGYYMGGGMVIEAQGTRAGVVTNLNGGSGKPLTKWHETAHFKGMNYVSTDDVITGGDVVYPILRKGATGEDVKKLQTLLRAKGFGLAVDGVYGTATVAAVKDFQRQNGLTVDGVCGPATWTALLGDVTPEPVPPAVDAETVSVPKEELLKVYALIGGWLQ